MSCLLNELFIKWGGSAMSVYGVVDTDPYSTVHNNYIVPNWRKHPLVSYTNHMKQDNSNSFLFLVLGIKPKLNNEPEDYVYSSARDYADIKGLIDIELIQ